MTTLPRMSPEAPEERALRFAQAKFDQLKADQKQGRHRPGSLKKHGRYSPARVSSDHGPWWEKGAKPTGWDE
jgi:hypothetical protein